MSMKFIEKSVVGIVVLLISFLGIEIVRAINITVPSAPAPNYFLVSTTTGAYVATTSNPLMVGAIYSTSTIATSTFNYGINIKGGCFSVGGTCISSGGSGTITQINTTWPVLGGPITTTGTITWGGLSTTTNLTPGHLVYSTGISSIADTATSSLAVISPITFSGTLGAQIGGANGSFGCSTCLTGNQSITLSGAVSGTGATSITTSYAGINGISTGGTNASSFTQSGGILAYDGTREVNFSGYTLTSSLLTAMNASTTNLTVNSTNIVGDGSGSDFITTTRSLSVTYATSTAWTGSTTLLDVGIAPFNIMFNTARCHTDAGTLNVQLQYSTGPTKSAMLLASSTIGTQTLSSNNTPAKGDDIGIVFGTPASSPTQINCTFSGPQTGI